MSQPKLKMTSMAPSSLFQTPPSRLTLGTAQFGLNYGVANRSGQPSFDDVCAILRRAYERGVNVIDTAPGYGSSEEVLGKALRQLDLVGKMRVVTKVSHLPAGLPI